MRIETAVLTHPGSVRPNNEDNYCFHGTILSASPDTLHVLSAGFSTERPVLMGVFDGMGGYQYGERASRIAAETAAEQIVNLTSENAPLTLMRICTQANERICEQIEHVVKGSMGSTASMAVLTGSKCVLCDIGDSPIYLLRGDQIERVSMEHTERQNYVEIFGKEPEKDKIFPLTQHLGIAPDELELEPYLAEGDMKAGDQLLLCSDGVSDMLSEEELTGLMMDAPTAKQAVESIWQAAVKSGGRDNITMIVVRFMEE